MLDQSFALLIHDHPEPFASLGPLLRDLSLKVWKVRSHEADQAVMESCKPGLIFVDLPVWNRSSARVAGLAWGAHPAPNVIVVGVKPDIEVYVAAIERGAYSFVAPPFSRDQLKSIVSAAQADGRAREEAFHRGAFGHIDSSRLLPHPVGRGVGLPHP
jgi:DNA-binding NtrC family response regulator